MVLLHEIIEILHLPDGDGGTILVIIPPDGLRRKSMVCPIFSTAR
jgi:hypothetical protein